MMSGDEARQLLARAEMIRSAADVSRALDRLATGITVELGGRFPVVLMVMRGAVFLAGQLLPRLDFPLEFDYLHATRYQGTTGGATIVWKVVPPESVRGRPVLVLDDILDEGHTLAAILDSLGRAGAAEVRVAVLCEKRTGRDKPVRADFVGFEVPDRYVFGCGMDVQGLWRNLPAIYALGEPA
jgi:hypoxanthine phosphoribosyltransferase